MMLFSLLVCSGCCRSILLQVPIAASITSSVTPIRPGNVFHFNQLRVKTHLLHTKNPAASNALPNNQGITSLLTHTITITSSVNHVQSNRPSSFSDCQLNCQCLKGQELTFSGENMYMNFFILIDRTQIISNPTPTSSLPYSLFTWMFEASNSSCKIRRLNTSAL